MGGQLLRSRVCRGEVPHAAVSSKTITDVRDPSFGDGSCHPSVRIPPHTICSGAWQVAEVRRQLAAAAEGAERAAAGAKDQSAKADRDRRAAEERSAESTAALARERADRKADAASFAVERKDLQVPTITCLAPLTSLPCNGMCIQRHAGSGMLFELQLCVEISISVAAVAMRRSAAAV